ncbi:MAG: DUF4417 domain-containing protein [Cellulosilyticum sp.]|nr:DUF4417 domain-containing protein [Cellulosilyticum sp.]
MSAFCNLVDRLYDGVGEYNIPVIKPVYEQDVTFWLGFNYVKSTKKATPHTGVHFFLDDPQFERVWYSPNTYVPYLKKFSCVLSPEFSVYVNFPKAIQIFNHYRKHWCAAYWQEQGLTVIPTITWGWKDSFEWCFDGEPEGGIVAVSNVGCMKNKEMRKLFNDGYNEMLTRLQPKEVLFYAHTFDDYKGPVHYIRYMNGLTDMVI